MCRYLVPVIVLMYFAPVLTMGSADVQLRVDAVTIHEEHLFKSIYFPIILTFLYQHSDTTDH